MMMITCWIGVVGDLAKAGAVFVSVQSALVARQSDSKNHFDLMNILHRAWKVIACDGGEGSQIGLLAHRRGEYRWAQLHADVRGNSDL
jgi:hypothetical protein